VKLDQLEGKLIEIEPTETGWANDVYSDLMGRMYLEDWAEGLVPLVFSGSDKFKITVDPEGQRGFLKALLDTEASHSDSLEESLSEFMKLSVQLIILEGGASFEICVDPEAEDGPSLRTVRFDSLAFSDNEVTQGVEDEFDPNLAQSIRVPRSKMLIIEPPSWIEGGAGFHPVVEEVMNWSKMDFSPLKFFQQQSAGKFKTFDYRKFIRRQEVAILRATRHDGWPGRSLYSDKMTEYYSVLRHLTFKFHHARLREHILQVINRFLQGLSVFEIPASTMTFTKLPSSQEIEKIIQDFSEGKVGFRDVLDKVRP